MIVRYHILIVRARLDELFGPGSRWAEHSERDLLVERALYAKNGG